MYLVGCLGTGLAGLYMAPYAYGGPITRFGFGTLARALLSVTAVAYRRIRARDVAGHREWMIRSYALMFAAAALRVEIPMLMATTGGDFDLTYRLVSWLCWVPNLAFAEWYVRSSRPLARSRLPACQG